MLLFGFIDDDDWATTAGCAGALSTCGTATGSCRDEVSRTPIGIIVVDAV